MLKYRYIYAYICIDRSICRGTSHCTKVRRHLVLKRETRRLDFHCSFTLSSSICDVSIHAKPKKKRKKTMRDVRVEKQTHSPLGVLRFQTKSRRRKKKDISLVSLVAEKKRKSFFLANIAFPPSLFFRV